jgi:hypothetical protein
MTAALLLNSCATVIHNFPLCAPYPGGNSGAHCDDFLTSNPQRLSDVQWKALQASWKVTQCTSDQAAVWLKGEIEKLCSVTVCTYDQAQMVNQISQEVGRTIRSNREALILTK